MNYKIIKAFSVCILCFVSLCANVEQRDGQYKVPLETTLSCTNFAASINETIFFGNSEDGGLDHPLGEAPLSSQMFYYPADLDGYGCAFVGWLYGTARSLQGGMNDQGLCYDLTGIPDAPLNSHLNQTYSVDGSWILKDVLRLNANVSEVIEFLKIVDFDGYVWFQWFFADALGDMVIVSPNPDGELAFTRKEAGEDGFLTQTNFNRVTNDGGFPCWRYDISTEMLGEIKNEGDLTYEAIDSVLEAVHFDKVGTFTGYSNAFDPVNQLLHLTFLSQFDDTVVINITEELAITSETIVPMTDYFSQETIDNGLSYYNTFKTKIIMVFLVLPITGVVIILISLILTIRFAVKRRRRKKKEEKISSNMHI